MCPTISLLRFLPDGRTGDNRREYNNGSFALTNLGAIYDPTTNKWTSLTPPEKTGITSEIRRRRVANGSLWWGTNSPSK